VVAIAIDWRKVIKAKSKRQRDLTQWTDEEWGSQEQHRAKAKGKKVPSKTKGRYMPKATYQRTPKKTLDYQDVADLTRQKDLHAKHIVEAKNLRKGRLELLLLLK
jgi:IMP dehydrogenase/GMP reductase